MDSLELFTSTFDDLYKHQVLIYIFVAFGLMLFFFLQSLKDLDKLEKQEQYDQQHSIYKPNEYDLLVNQWTRNAIDNLKQDQRYQQWLCQKQSQQDNLSQSSFKQSSIK